MIQQVFKVSMLYHKYILRKWNKEQQKNNNIQTK